MTGVSDSLQQQPPAQLAVPPHNMATLMAAEDSRIDSTHTRQLAVEIEGLTFFKDNEYEGRHTHGYSLPGFWLRPRLTWQPLSALRLELGAHALVFDGANKYPCYAYHDIGHWKGNQYQRGAHVLPFFRATAVLGKTTFVLGDIYGGAAHGLMEPLFAPEVNLTQDPEMGVQIMHCRRHFNMDVWLNWQSYIFEEDTHQEAFTVGLSLRHWIGRGLGRVKWYIPVDVVVQHRGGEQDLPELELGVQTLCNAGAGVGMRWQPTCRAVESVDASAAALGAYQQSGSLWPFDTGWAATAAAETSLRCGVRAYGRVLTARDFVPLYGVPFFGTLSYTGDGGHFDGVTTTQIGVEWSHTFARDYMLGAKAETYISHTGQLTSNTGITSPSRWNNDFSFGIYLRIRPRFILKDRL